MKIIRENELFLNEIKKIHMIGIGGSGMCPLAEIMHSKGYILTGSDNNTGDNITRLSNMGIEIFMGHKAENVKDAELVVYSAAISKDNPEITEANRLGIPTMERSEFFGAITRKFDKVIGIAGTHGKTSATSMLSQIMILNEMDPTAIIGGRLPLIEANGRAGDSEIMVCEACEYVDTFLQLSPDYTVLLNIDNDHLEYFKTMDNLVNSFSKFIGMSKHTFINGDDELCHKAASGLDIEVTTFGLDENNDYFAKNIRPGKKGMNFDVYNKDRFIINIEMSVPGRHNIYNALAAISVADYFGIECVGIKLALEQFTGAGRRFEFLCTKDDITYVDDYAHHPTEICATLNAAKSLDYKKVVAVFQPFTFSRTALLKEEFCEALSIADNIILTPIMGSREVNTYGITSEQLAENIENSVCVKDFDEALKKIKEIAKAGDLVITMGGGDIYKVSHYIRDNDEF